MTSEPGPAGTLEPVDPTTRHRPATRRQARDWSTPLTPQRPQVEVLIPTSGRRSELAVTLAGLAAQDGPCFDVIISDQSDDHAMATEPAVTAMIRVLAAQGRPVQVHRHTPRRGMAEHRAFLLAHATAPLVLFLDDDVWLEPHQLAVLVEAIDELGCGAVGMAVQGLSFLPDQRPHQQVPFEAWDGDVRPERIRPDSPAMARWSLHAAANLTHIAARTPIPAQGWLPYKVAWLSGCVLYRRQHLEDVGGFDFWPALPPHHAGEDVVAQWNVMEQYGAAGILPSGAVHLEAPTTITDRTIDAATAMFTTHPKPSAS